MLYTENKTKVSLRRLYQIIEARVRLRLRMSMWMRRRIGERKKS